MLKEFELWRISNPDTSFGQLENLDLDTVDHMPLIGSPTIFICDLFR